MGKCQPLLLARERKYLFFSGQLKPSDLTLFQWFYAKLPMLKPIFHTDNNQNLQVGWVIKNYIGSFLLTGKNIYIWLSINLESILYLSSIKFFKYWINKQGKTAAYIQYVSRCKNSSNRLFCHIWFLSMSKKPFLKCTVPPTQVPKELTNAKR